MALQQILAKKRRGQPLSTAEIEEFVRTASSGEAHHAQIGAMLMAMSIHGMSEEEIQGLTGAMVKSGTKMEWEGIAADKHSTGGVGDKVSIPLVPILAELGLKIPMISGRSLEYTGGTLDKLESIPGYNVNLTIEEMKKCLETCGGFISAATQDVCPADKILYSIRDITSTVDCNGLVTASILSKKIAEGAKYLIQDVKVGNAAFYKDTQSAEELARTMIATAEGFGLKMAVSMTKMDHPIGRAVGNSLEIIECIDILKGKHFPPDLMELIIELGGELLVMTGLASSFSEAKENMKTTLKNGKALKRFEKLLINQGVNENVANKICSEGDYSILPKAKFITEFLVKEKGYVEKINALSIAKVCFNLGAGRNVPSDRIDHAVGCLIQVVQGENVDPGKCWAVLHHNTPLDPKIQVEMDSALKVSTTSVPHTSILIKTIRSGSCTH
uniref:Thymidine phosphorylase n=1 Tax=Riptortus pedestris TaxID=329032 RepID=R4WDP7_RIPPE|nr:unkown protein [Riptortus pedestris]